MVDVRFAQGVRTGLSVNMGSGMRKMLKQLGLAAAIGSSAVLAGCYDTGDQALLDELLNEKEVAVDTAKKAQEEIDKLKAEVETLKAAETLVGEGFTVLPYINADPVLAKRLQDVGTATVMPLASPIGSNRGIEARRQIEIIVLFFLSRSRGPFKKAWASLNVVVFIIYFSR